MFLTTVARERRGNTIVSRDGPTGDRVIDDIEAFAETDTLLEGENPVELLDHSEDAKVRASEQNK